MINFAKKSLVLALLAGIGFGATVAQAQERVYVIDQRDVVAKSGFDLCWRTGYWTPAAAAKDPAGCQCDKDLIPAEVCNPPVKAAAAGAAAGVGSLLASARAGRTGLLKCALTTFAGDGAGSSDTSPRITASAAIAACSSIFSHRFVCLRSSDLRRPDRRAPSASSKAPRTTA